MRVQIVSFHCVLKNQLGQTISSSFNQDVVTTDPEQSVHGLPGFAKALERLKTGERKTIFVPAEEAYGLYIPQLQFEIPRSQLKNGKKLRVGDEITGALQEDQKVRKFRVVSLNPKKAVLDGNHPLAGQDLVFDVELTSKRECIQPEEFAVRQDHLLLH